MEGSGLKPATYHVPWMRGERVTEIRYMPNGPDAEFANWLASQSRVGMDIETTGFEIGSRTFEIRTLQIGDQDISWVFPSQLGIFSSPIVVALNHLMQFEGIVVTHNGIFDWVSIGTMHGREYAPRNIADTYYLARHWDPRGKGDGPGAIGHSMEALVRVWIDEDDAEDLKGSVTKAAKELGITKGEYFANVPIDDPTYIKYAGMDCAFTMELYDRLYPALASTGVHSLSLIEDDYRDFRDAVEMGVRGMAVNTEYLVSLKEELEEQERAAKARALAEYGVTSLASPKQLYQAFTDAGVSKDSFDRTPKGSPQVNSKKLKQLADEGHELAKIVIEGKRAQKWRKAYIDMIMACSHGSGRIHPQINIFGARTGRYSVSNPPLQQLPSGTDMIRRAFIADPGCSIVSVDYSGQELRLCAALSGDVNLIADFTAGINPMKRLTAQVFGDDYTPDEYKRTKICVYAMLYGGGVDTIANQTGLSAYGPESVMAVVTGRYTGLHDDRYRSIMEEFGNADGFSTLAKARKVAAVLGEHLYAPGSVADIKDKWHALYPGAKLHSDQLSAQANQYGYITGIAGRVLVLDPGHGYAASNAEFQNGGRELISKAIREIPDEWRHTVRLQVHDELVFVVPNDELDAFTDMIVGVMETEINGIHFPVEVEVCGQSWAGHYS